MSPFPASRPASNTPRISVKPCKAGQIAAGSTTQWKILSLIGFRNKKRYRRKNRDRLSITERYCSVIASIFYHLPIFIGITTELRGALGGGLILERRPQGCGRRAYRDVL